MGVGLEDEVAEEVFRFGPRFGKVSPTSDRSRRRKARSSSGPVQGARVPDSRPSVPQAPETTRGRGKREEPSNQGPTHPRSRKRRLRDSPEGRGAGDGEVQHAATTPAPSLSSPQRPEGEVSPGPGRDRRESAGRAPPASRLGP